MENKEEVKKDIEKTTTATPEVPEVPKEKPVVETPKPVIEAEKKPEIKVELPKVEEEKKEEPKAEVKPAAETPKVEEKKEPVAEEKKEEAPAVVIPEEKEDVKVEGNKMEAADFSNTFGVASEENADGTPKVPEVPTKEVTEEKKEDNGNQEIINQAFDAGEEKEDVKIKGNELEAANFSQMFGVASEEAPVKEEPLKGAPAPVEAPEAPKQEVVIPESVIQEVIDGKKTSKFNSEEKTLYTIKEEKTGNPIIVVIFFIILGFFIVILPQVTNTSESALEKIYGRGGVITKPVEEEIEKKYYYFEETTKYQVDDLIITNAVLQETNNTVVPESEDPEIQKKNKEYTITMTIFNTTSEPFYFDKNYYILLYDQNQLVFRAKFFSYDAIAPKGAQDFTFTVNEKAKKEANRFTITLIDKDDYPEAEIYTEEDGFRVLRCNYKNDEMKYYFKDDMLVKIQETYAEQASKYNVGYDTRKEEYRALSEKYRKIENFSSDFAERKAEDPSIVPEFKMVNNIDLSKIEGRTISNLKVYRYFKYNEHKNVVLYEVQSLGYTCSG